MTLPKTDATSQDTSSFSPFLWDKRLTANLPGEPNPCLSFSLKLNKTPALITDLVVGSVSPENRTKLLRLVQTWLVGAGTLRGVEMQETMRAKIHAARTFARAATLCGQRPHEKFESHVARWESEEDTILQQLEDADVSFLTTPFVYLSEGVVRMMVERNLTHPLSVRWPYVAWNQVFGHLGLAEGKQVHTMETTPSKPSTAPAKGIVQDQVGSTKGRKTKTRVEPPLSSQPKKQAEGDFEWPDDP